MELSKLHCQSKRGFSLIELMVVIAIISLLAAIAIPNYFSYRNKSYCTLAETDANNVSRAISSYFAIGAHTGLPNSTDLNININNGPVDISGDPNTTITIIVTDKTGRCPIDYQKSRDGWNTADNTYTYYIK